MIKTAPFFLQKEGVNKIELGIKRDLMGLKNANNMIKGVNSGKVP